MAVLEKPEAPGLENFFNYLLSETTAFRHGSVLENKLIWVLDRAITIYFMKSCFRFKICCYNYK